MDFPGRSVLKVVLLVILVASLANAQPRVDAIVNGASGEPFVCAGALVLIQGTGLATTETASLARSAFLSRALTRFDSKRSSSVE